MMSILTQKKHFKLQLLTTIFLVILTPILNIYLFEGFNFFNIITILVLIAFLVQYISFSSSTSKIKSLHKQVFVAVIKDDELILTDTKDIINGDKIKLESGEMVRISGVIKSGMGIFNNSDTYKKRMDNIKSGDLLSEGEVIYEARR